MLPHETQNNYFKLLYNILLHLSDYLFRHFSLLLTVFHKHHQIIMNASFYIAFCPLSYFFKKKIRSFYFLKVLLFIFRERGREGKRERERNIYVWLPLTWPPLKMWTATQACALTGNCTGDPLVCRPCSIH